MNVWQMPIDKNYTIGREGKTIDKIVIHHAAGTGQLEMIQDIFNTLNRNASAHYGVRGQDIAQYVSEDNTAWANSNRLINQTSISIEVVNVSKAPDWRVSCDTYETLIELVVDITARHGLYPLIPGGNLNWHSMYAATTCPGPYLLGKIPDLADRVNGVIADMDKLQGLIEPCKPVDYTIPNFYRVRNKFNNPQSQQGAFNDYGKAQLLCNVLNDNADEPTWFVYNQDGKRLYPKGN